jgi:hypothetical protein
MVYGWFRRFMEKITPSHILEVDELQADDLDMIVNRLRAFPDDDFVIGRAGRGFAAFVSPRKFAHMALQIRNRRTEFDHHDVSVYTLQDMKRVFRSVFEEFENGPTQPVMITRAENSTGAMAFLISARSSSGD